MNDLRFAVRQLSRAPGFTAVALFTVALGIGACVAIFSVVDAVLLRPMPYPDPERLVTLSEKKLPRFTAAPVAPGKYFEWRRQATSFQGLAALRDGSYNLTGAGEPVRVSAGRLTANTFSVLGIRPVMGRDFSEAEDVPGRENVVILGHGLWMRQFGGRPEILDRTVQLDGRPFTVIGVMPPSFQVDWAIPRAGGPIDVFTPAAYSAGDRQDRRKHTLSVVGRLGPGVTLEQAQSEMDLVARRIDDSAIAWGVNLTPVLEGTVRNIRPMLLSLLGAVAFLLLIACANVANLLLARATARGREIAVRAALGARRGRIVRQLLIESAVLGLGGGLLGVLVASWGQSALVALASTSLPRAAEIGIDARVLAFASVLALATSVVFGMAPALSASRVTLHETLKASGRGTPSGGRLRSTLVVAETAIALVLLVGAGLLIRSFVRLQEVDPGFRAQGALAVSLPLSQEKYRTDRERAAFAQAVEDGLAGLPGVQSVGSAQVVPFSGPGVIYGFRIEGDTEPRDGGLPEYHAVTPDYFRTLGIPLRRGRAFQASDTAGAARVALISESTARSYFPGEDPIGRRIAFNLREPGVWREIVGVVADVKNGVLNAGPTLQTYEPYAQSPGDALTVVVRAAPAVDPAAIRAAIRAVDGNQPIASLRPLTEWVAQSIARQRFAMWLFAVFSVVALLLASVGIYGVMAYAVARRTSEIGIRMALGAHAGDVLRLVFAQGGRLILLGVAAGVVASLLLTRFVQSMLFGVSAHDPLTFAAIIAGLSLVATLACWLPARRAAAVDPMTALRSE
jgi:putative ABC transport system permease protein